MTHRSGCVLITNNDLAAKCDVCRKSFAYVVGSHMHIDTFKRLMTEFVRKHIQECGRKEEGENE